MFVTKTYHNLNMHDSVSSGARTGGARGATAPPPIFGRSVNPIQTGEGRLSPPITTGTPNVFHLPASLHKTHSLPPKNLRIFSMYLHKLSAVLLPLYNSDAGR